MNKMIRIPMITAVAGTGLFAASLVVYYFNLDMKLMAAMYPIMEKWYDRIEHTPMPVPAR